MDRHARAPREVGGAPGCSRIRRRMEGNRMSPSCAPASLRSGRLPLLTAILTGLIAAGAALADGGALRVGTCKREITPVSPPLQAAYQAAFGVAGVVNHTDPIFLAGFGDNRRATGYHDRLWARGVVLESQGKRVAIVALDLIGYFKNEIDTARAMISPESAIGFAVVASTHQHEGPDTLGIWGPDGTTTGTDCGYL